MDSDENWAVMHRVAGPWVNAGGVVTMALGAVVAVAVRDEGTLTPLVLAAMAVSMGLLFNGVRLGTAALKTREAATAGEDR